MEDKKKRVKSRGNGQGTAYLRGKTWEACVTIQMITPEDDTKNPYPKKLRKGGFRTKKEALEWCLTAKTGGKQRIDKSLSAVYDEWEKKYSPRVGASTMAGYKAAYKHFSKLHPLYIDTITAQDLQDCMDECKAGKRTHQQMKVVAGLIWGYAVDSNYADRDVTTNLYTGKGTSIQRDPITEEEVEIIRKAIGTEQYAEYVYALCYLGFRPGEFLAIKKSDYHEEEITVRDKKGKTRTEKVAYLIGGGKTEAGTDRRVPIPAAIASIINARLKVEDTDLLFPMYVMNRKKEFTGYKKMTDAYFREFVFKPMMARLGIADGKVPYAARHTYSDKLKNAAGDDKTKAAIIGHTDYDFTRKRYQSTDINDLKTVVDSLE